MSISITNVNWREILPVRIVEGMNAERTLPVIDTSRAPNGIYLIDTFTVPAGAREKFEAAMLRNREFIRTLEGFRGDAVFVRTQGDAFDIATIAAWENAEVIARAKDRVADYYRSIGFDMHASIAEWGVTLVRTICEAPAQFRLT